MKNIDRYRGCLIGGAAGDALGYAVEFFRDKDIFARYGKNGITEYTLRGGVAEISDDTQMTLFTANGLLFGTTRGMMRGIMASYPSYIHACYKDWYRTQNERYPLSVEGFGGKPYYSWLANLPQMFSCRAPGGTCLSALGSGTYGTIDSPINQSKGCGGVMRVAPIGLYFDGERHTLPLDEIDRIGAETAALTHGHPLGYIPAAGLVHIIHLVAHKDVSLRDAVADMKEAMVRQFAREEHPHRFSRLFDKKNSKEAATGQHAPNEHLDLFLKLVDKAVELSAVEGMEDVEAIRQLGEGWVAEETLAIAIYCSLKYAHDFDRALIAAVNHSGDSDSTGAVTGNILGAYLGLQGIPSKYLENLELKDVILDIADDLFHDCQMTEYGSYRDEIWEKKYIGITYAK